MDVGIIIVRGPVLTLDVESSILAGDTKHQRLLLYQVEIGSCNELRFSDSSIHSLSREWQIYSSTGCGSAAFDTIGRV